MRAIHLVSLTGLAALLMVSAGCGSGGKKPEQSPNLPTVLPPLDAPVVWQNDQKLEEAATAFAKIVENTLNHGDERFMQAHMDYAGMLKAAAESWKVAESNLSDFEKRVTESGMPSKLAREVTRGATIKLVHVREVDKQWRALLRLVSRDGLQYHELYLAPDAQRTIKIVDAYSYLSRLKVSESLRRVMLPLAIEHNKAIVDTLTPMERAYVDNVSTVAELQTKMLEGNYNEALKLYDSLPDAVKAEPDVAQMRFACARQVDMDAYIKALDDYRTRYANKASDLLLIKFFFAAGRQPEGLDALDRLEKATGGDGLIDHFRAQAYKKLNDTTKAKACARRAIEADPNLERPYYLLFDYSLEEKDYGETIRLLEAFEKNVPQANLNLEQEHVFADFLKSKEYEEWMKRRGQW